MEQQFEDENKYSTEEIISRIIEFKDINGESLLKKYSLQYIISLLDRNKIESIYRVYSSKEDKLNLLEFVRFFLNIFEHSTEQTLYLTIALVQLFKDISRTIAFSEKIRLLDITNYICNIILNQRNQQNLIETKHLSIKPLVLGQQPLKDYLINPPITYGDKEQITYKLSISSLKIDKNKHESAVTNCYFSKTQAKVYSLDALCDTISIYDCSCQLLKKVKPTSSKLKRDVIILSFAYSERQERLGAVLKDFSLIFWDCFDNFVYEKVFTSASYCQDYQTNIWYLQHFCEWITSDKAGIISIWSLQSQQPKRVINCRYNSKINDLCEIACLGLLAILQQSKTRRDINSIYSANSNNLNKQIEHESTIIIYNFIKGQSVSQVQFRNDKKILHTLQYSQTYQVLFAGGFQKKIHVFQINNKYLDITLKGQLLGHQSLITSFAIIHKTPMIISSDDKGKIKIWDIRYYKCIQTLDFKDKIAITKILNMAKIGKIGIFGSRINFLQFDNKQEISKKCTKKLKNQPIAIDCQYDTEEIIILTNKDVRMYDMKKGTAKKIFCDYHSSDDEITSYTYLQSLRKIVIGNQKGQIKVYCLRTGQQDFKMHGHTASVSFIEYDQHTRLFVSIGLDFTINIWHQSSRNLWQPMRQMRNNFNGHEITCFCISFYHGLIAIGSNERNIYIWDYQNAKIILHLQLPKQICEPTSLTFINAYSLLVIGTSQGNIFILKLDQVEQQLKSDLIWYYKRVQLQTITHVLTDIKFKGYSFECQALQFCKLHVALSSGFLRTFQLTKLLSRLPKKDSRVNNGNYNSERQFKENFCAQLQKSNKLKINLIDPQLLQQNQCLQNFEFQAHKNSINSLKILQYDKHYLCSASIDEHLKIWLNNEQICNLNINFPLPYNWNLHLSDKNKIKDQIMFSLKIIQSIFKIFGNEITTSEAKLMTVDNLFKKIETKQVYNHLTQPQDHEVANQMKKITLLQNEFQPLDLHYDFIKKCNFKQIAGPSLRQIQFKKKISQMQKQAKQKNKQQQEEKIRMFQIIKRKSQKNQQKQQFMNIFQQKSHILNRRKNNCENQLPMIKELEQKIDNMISITTDKTTSVNLLSKNGKFRDICTKQLQCWKPTDSSQNKKRVTFQDYFKKKIRGSTSMCQRQINQEEKNLKNNNFKDSNNSSTFKDIIRKMNMKLKISLKMKNDKMEIKQVNQPIKNFKIMRSNRNNLRIR